MRLIDADALKKAVEDFPNCYNGWSDTYDKAFIIGAIEEAPTIDAVSVVHGEWLPFEYGDDTWHKCSVCGIADKYKGSMPRPNGTIGEWEYVRNFCPICGAKMDGERKESE